VRVGVVGCGAVSDKYFETLKRFAGAEVVACADSVYERALHASQRHGVSNAMPTAKLIQDPGVDLVLNLTPPVMHAEINKAALNAGKHLYSEKPLATGRSAAADLLRMADEHGSMLGSAPDTFLGSAHQSGRSFIESGGIGLPVAASASFLSNGYENSRPRSAKYYSQPGGGPMFSPGLYFVSSLISIFGSVRRVYGMGRRTYTERVIGIGQDSSQAVTVKADTHVVGLMEFTSGPVATIVASFDVAANRSGIEIYGTDGTLRLPDPRSYGGQVQLKGTADTQWKDLPVIGRGNDVYGIGLMDMITNGGQGRAYRTAAIYSYHVLEVAIGVIDSIGNGRSIAIESQSPKPALLTEGFLT
jgi:predicted dehydrogenase